MDAATLAMARVNGDKRYSWGGGNAAILMNKLKQGLENAVLYVSSDSTGTIGTAPWPYQVAQQLATMFPAYTVNYRVWADDTQTFDALGATSRYPTGTNAQTTSQVIQIGTGTGNSGGPFVLDVYNGSMPGGTVSYVLANQNRLNAMFPATPDLIIMNWGHNSAGQGAPAYRITHYALCRVLEERYPLAGIIQVAQNPRSVGQSELGADAQRGRAVAGLAATEGYGLVNVLEAFQADPAYSTNLILADGLFEHPNPTGSTLWANEVMAHLRRGLRTVPRGPYRRPTRLWLPASAFSATVGTPTLGMVNGGASPAASTVSAPGWTFSAGVDSRVAATVDIPTYWGGIYDIVIFWMHSVASGLSAGNNTTRWSSYTQGLGLDVSDIGMTLGSGVAPTGLTHHQAGNTSLTAVNGAYLMAFATLASGVSGITIKAPTGIQIARNASDAADTFANNIYFLGAMLLRDN